MEQMENLLFLGVPILKHFRVCDYQYVLPCTHFAFFRVSQKSMSERGCAHKFLYNGL